MIRAATIAAVSFGLIVTASAQNYPSAQDRDPQDRPNQDQRDSQDQRPRDDRDRDSPDRDRDTQDRNSRYSRNYADSIPSGTQIRVRTNQLIDVRDRSDGRIYTGSVSENVEGQDGAVLIPRGATAELIIQNVGNNDMSVDLDSISINGRRYMVTADQYDRSRRTGVGANKRTGEYVGGGAVLGTLLGAIAGGGRGAAIGALAGGAAGAGTQVLTRGQAVRVPAETVLTFRLEQPLAVGSGNYQRDNGYERDGHHYHDDYYHRQPQQDDNYNPPPPPPQR